MLAKLSIFFWCNYSNKLFVLSVTRPQHVYSGFHLPLKLHRMRQLPAWILALLLPQARPLVSLRRCFLRLLFHLLSYLVCYPVLHKSWSPQLRETLAKHPRWMPVFMPLNLCLQMQMWQLARVWLRLMLEVLRTLLSYFCPVAAISLSYRSTCLLIWYYYPVTSTTTTTTATTILLSFAIIA